MSYPHQGGCCGSSAASCPWRGTLLRGSRESSLGWDHSDRMGLRVSKSRRPRCRGPRVRGTRMNMSGLSGKGTCSAIGEELRVRVQETRAGERTVLGSGVAKLSPVEPQPVPALALAVADRTCAGARDGHAGSRSREEPGASHGANFRLGSGSEMQRTWLTAGHGQRERLHDAQRHKATSRVRRAQPDSLGVKFTSSLHALPTRPSHTPHRPPPPHHHLTTSPPPLHPLFFKK